MRNTNCRNLGSPSCVYVRVFYGTLAFPVSGIAGLWWLGLATTPNFPRAPSFYSSQPAGLTMPGGAARRTPVIALPQSLGAANCVVVRAWALVWFGTAGRRPGTTVPLKEREASAVGTTDRDRGLCGGQGDLGVCRGGLARDLWGLGQKYQKDRHANH